jgi:hypothetical protein
MTDQHLVSTEATSYGCHVDLAPGEHPDGCVLDYGAPQDCNFGVFPSGRIRRSKKTCPHWRKFDASPSKNLREFA